MIKYFSTVKSFKDAGAGELTQINMGFPDNLFTQSSIEELIKLINDWVISISVIEPRWKGELPLGEWCVHNKTQRR